MTGAHGRSGVWTPSWHMKRSDGLQASQTHSTQSPYPRGPRQERHPCRQKRRPGAEAFRKIGNTTQPRSDPSCRDTCTTAPRCVSVCMQTGRSSIAYQDAGPGLRSSPRLQLPAIAAQSADNGTESYLIDAAAFRPRSAARRMPSCCAPIAEEVKTANHQAQGEVGEVGARTGVLLAAQQEKQQLPKPHDFIMLGQMWSR